MGQGRKSKREIESYAHADKERVNNPPVGLVTPETDKDTGRNTYAYDPHFDPQLQWAGKAEHTSFEVPTVSLHVHERMDPRTVIEAVRKRNGSSQQLSMFETPGENPPIRQAIEFYRHRHNWTNRLIAGDSLLVKRIQACRGTVSLPFEAGEHHRVAVKIVDDRGIESLKIVEISEST